MDKQLKMLPELVSSVRKGGLTIAVEAASEKLRRIVNKSLLNIISVIIASASFVFAIKGYNVSKDANKTSKKALEISERHFVQLNRPHITIDPEKFKSGLYWNIIQKKQDIELQIQYILKNQGNVAANNLGFPNEVLVMPMQDSERDEYNMAHTNNTMPTITLSPGESKIFSVSSVHSYENSDEAMYSIDHLNSEESNGIEIEFSVEYENGVDRSKKYSTYVHHKILKDSVQLLKQEVIEIPN